jgi:D-alanyl-D-alanine carboxypeptidase
VYRGLIAMSEASGKVPVKTGTLTVICNL